MYLFVFLSGRVSVEMRGYNWLVVLLCLLVLCLIVLYLFVFRSARLATMQLRVCVR
jgi:Tfp pilus assembly protein PilX